ncbi:uncharacterized protein C5L36_0E04810 [Pichia kudriavzevii]|uniref:Trafficking protein particle complex subunit 6B n=1 Tax=Pichia kudriavzevii TaxID=4909 RepID=A0A2U9RC05_PICKU|nr:uncharacterized protein C5L36_0E04810 [Pichia kudriavzevii]AWU78428.1 hypothetical protein C5L36_0E04810 [Pichia kudriavzevii]
MATGSTTSMKNVSITTLEYLLNEHCARHSEAELHALGIAVGTKAALRLLEGGAPQGGPPQGDPPVLRTPLECVKFVCRDVWAALEGRAMDSLRTNHAGTFLLRDAGALCYRRCWAGAPEETLGSSGRFLAFSGGVLVGALAATGVAAKVEVAGTETGGAEYTVEVA